MTDNSKTMEGKTMRNLVDSFCKEWCSKKTELEEMKEETINLIANIQSVFIMGSIKSGDYVGCNLHSEYNSLLGEIKELRDQVKFMRDSEETLKLAMERGNAELKESLAKSKATRSKSKVDYGVFSSKVAKEFAEEQGINGEDIEGTGKDKKVTKKDIQKHLSSTKTKPKKNNTKKKPKKFCNGAKDDGSPCKNSGSLLIRGKWYCKKHQSQAVQEELKEEEEEEYSDYDEEKDTAIEDPLTRFRKESLKSLEKMDEEDEELNAIMGEYNEEEDVVLSD